MTLAEMAEYAREKYDTPGRRWERRSGPIGEERREGCSFEQALAEALAQRAAIDANDKRRKTC